MGTRFDLLLFRDIIEVTRKVPLRNSDPSQDNPLLWYPDTELTCL